MPKCMYCGENAGFLKKVHSGCASAWAEMVSAAARAAKGESEELNPVPHLGKIAEGTSIRDLRPALIEGWARAVNELLEDSVLSQEEETHLTAYMEECRLSQHDLDESGSYTRMIQGIVLREVAEGQLPSRMSLQGDVPFNFQKNEQLVWVFPGVQYYELRTRRERTGGFGGVSARAMKGVYLHAGRFASQYSEKSSTEHVDTGLLGITDKHLYFSGQTKKFRVPYNKIVDFEPFGDGLGIMRDASSAKPQTFITGDGWFISNLVASLAQR